MSLKSKSLALHKKLRGKIEIRSRAEIKSLNDLSLLYTPGVAAVSEKIFKNKNLAYDLTSKWNTIAIITDGSRLLGLGNIGPEASIPVMEGKSAIFKKFGDVNAIPLCLKTQDADKIVEIAKNIAPNFAAINLEDIESPKCFYISEQLEKELGIPVFHDDQHGTAVVALAGLINSLKIVRKKISSAKIVIAGAGAAGIAIAKLLYKYGARNIILSDSHGIIYSGRKNLNKWKKEVAACTNRKKIKGDLKTAIKGADIFIGVSGIPNLLKPDLARSMARNAIIFALTNPEPEILPPLAKKCKNVAIVATGRSDFPNQINNCLVFPAIFRAALDSRSKKITEKMKFAAAKALADYVPKKKLGVNYIIPKVTDKNVFKKVAKAVYNAVK